MFGREYASIQTGRERSLVRKQIFNLPIGEKESFVQQVCSERSVQGKVFFKYFDPSRNWWTKRWLRSVVKAVVSQRMLPFVPDNAVPAYQLSKPTREQGVRSFSRYKSRDRGPNCVYTRAGVCVPVAENRWC